MPVLIYVLAPTTYRLKSYRSIVTTISHNPLTSSLHDVLDETSVYHRKYLLQVLTKDSVTVSVDAVVYYRVHNATISIANVENAHHSTRLLAQTTLRNTMGTRPLHEILSERETISGNMQLSLDEATEAWGIKVERVEIKDVRLPVQLQRAMAAEAEAAREARAKVIAAEGEQKASRALREASEVIGDSPAALQLRYLQTLNTISAEKNSTIVFPLPIDLLTYFLKAKEES
ncbi:unnamed protein product [Diatraea saccharalis]|uniref:Band 7 domain-containing protein n=1 Tax=Diatraea saccharalis TaxID=40085 RepID=A0A9N9WCE7_9NEOP|nr:unnamed protein product [Diatraea saccharalis]